MQLWSLLASGERFCPPPLLQPEQEVLGQCPRLDRDARLGGGGPLRITKRPVTKQLGGSVSPLLSCAGKPAVDASSVCWGGSESAEAWRPRDLKCGASLGICLPLESDPGGGLCRGAAQCVWVARLPAQKAL